MNKTIGFVPTMGYLHQGHLSLIRRARRDCKAVTVSIYVNPTQFGPKEDFDRYPRNTRRDRMLASREKVDYLFTPDGKDMYPGPFETHVSVRNLSKGLCGTSRSHHFEGVCTVVAKLFNIVEPDIAYFGQKDFQQAVIIKQMVKDLNMNVKIKVLPIIREDDGLAMSSRNEYLTDSQKKTAPILYHSLQEAKKIIKGGLKDSKKIIDLIKRIIKSQGNIKIDYVEIVDPNTLRRKEKIDNKVLIALAVWIGKTRLIDNILVNS